ncbi:MAG: succinylglutamate desuccinylase/aspartoacylase family protein [Steroidobacteraceae bacterium]
MLRSKQHTVSHPKLAIAASCFLLAFSADRAQGATWPDRIGTAEVRPGEVTRGRLPLIEYADGSDIEAPVIVVAGKQRGPVVWLLSCGHGDEFGGALALQRVVKALDPATMTGLVILIPVANPPAFQAMRRVNPSPDDLMDFGSAFPGESRFATERIAEKYTALWKEHADYVVDLHTGGDRFVQHPFVIFTVTGTVPPERMESLARMFGVPTLWRDRDKVFESDIIINVPAMGIPAFLLEVGGGGVMERQQDARQAEFALSFLRGIDIIPGDPLRAERVSVVEKYRIITPSRGGFFYALVKPGDPVSEGSPLARIVDVYGDEVEVLRSPVGGAIVLGIQEFPLVTTGSWVAELGILAPE